MATKVKSRVLISTISVVLGASAILWQVNHSFARTIVGPSTGIFPVAKMNSARSGHTATLLPDGKVLIAGGMVRNHEFLRTAELFDPATRKFTYTGPMSTERVGQAAVLLKNGKVLMAGGWTLHGPTDSAELYDPGLGTFTELSGRMSTARARASATVLESGKVLLAGGAIGDREFLDSAELFDPTTNGFVPTGRMQQSRISHTATLLPNGTVLVAAGMNTDHHVLASAEIYDSKVGIFSPAGNLLTARYKHTSAVLPGGKVLIAGGSDERDWHGNISHAEIYDFRSRQFVAAPDMSEARFKLPDQAASLPSGSVLIAGGARISEVYDPNTGKFIPVAGLLDAPRHYMTETALKDGSVLLVGGYPDGPEATAQAWLYQNSK